MAKTSVDNTARDAVASGGREGTGGGPEHPDAHPPRGMLRNSSGERSLPSRLIDMELKLRILTRAVSAIANQLGDEQLVYDLKQVLHGKATK